MTLQYRTRDKYDEEPWTDWKTVPANNIIEEHFHELIELRETPAFEPGWYRSLVSDEVHHFIESPHVAGMPNIWKRVRFVDDDE
jgi:hypothetical protein